MTLAESVTMLGQKAALEQSVFSGTDSGTGWSLSNDNATSLINEAVRRVAVKCALRDPKIALTLSASNTVRLNDSSAVGAVVWRPMKVVIAETPLLDASGREYGVWTLDEFERFWPKWRTETGTDSIVAACYTGHVIGSGSNSGGGQLVFNQVPSAGTIALNTHYIDGYAYPHPMTYSGDSAKQLKLPPELHFVTVDLAKIIGETPNVTEGEHWSRLEKENSDVRDMVAWFRKEEERAGASWGSTRGSYMSDEVWF